MQTQRRIGVIVLGCVMVSLAVLVGLIAWLGVVRGIMTGVAIAMS